MVVKVAYVAYVNHGINYKYYGDSATLVKTQVTLKCHVFILWFLQPFKNNHVLNKFNFHFDSKKWCCIFGVKG